MGTSFRRARRLWGRPTKGEFTFEKDFPFARCRMLDSLRLQILVDRRIGERRIVPEVPPKIATRYRMPMGSSADFRRAVPFSGSVSISVSNLPAWLVEATERSIARPPTACLIAGSIESRYAPFVSSYPVRRLKTDWHSWAPKVCCAFFPWRASCRKRRSEPGGASASPTTGPALTRRAGR
jgi:hypothetical protein